MKSAGKGPRLDVEFPRLAGGDEMTKLILVPLRHLGDFAP